MIKDSKFNIVEIALVFLAIMFKYLINIHVARRYLYVFLIVIIFFTVVLFFHKRMSRNQLFRGFILFLVALYFTVFYDDANFLISFILAVLCINKKEDSFIKVFFFSSLILYSTTILFNIFGIIKSNDMYRVAENGYKIRYSLGFTHPNEVFLYLLPIVLTGYYLYGKQKKFMIITFIVSLILYNLSYCRTGFAVVIILLILDFLTRKKKEFKYIKKIVPFIFILFTAFSIFLAFRYGNNLTNDISSALNGRPYYWNYYIQHNTLFSLFGNNKVEGYFLDNFYIYMLVQLGLVGYFIYLFIYYKSLSIMNFSKRYSIIILIFLIYGLFEANVIIGSIQFLFAIQLKEIITNGGRNAKSIERKEISN